MTYLRNKCPPIRRPMWESNCERQFGVLITRIQVRKRICPLVVIGAVEWGLPMLKKFPHFFIVSPYCVSVAKYLSATRAYRQECIKLNCQYCSFYESLSSTFNILIWNVVLWVFLFLLFVFLCLVCYRFSSFWLYGIVHSFHYQSRYFKVIIRMMKVCDLPCLCCLFHVLCRQIQSSLYEVLSRK